MVWLALTVRTEVGATAAYNDLFDGRGTDATGLPLSRVDTMFKLKEARNAFGVHVVGDRRAPKLDRPGEHVDQGLSQLFEFGAGHTRSLASGSDAGAGEGLVGVDVADAVEQ